MAIFNHVTTIGSGPNLSGIGSLEIAWINGFARLFVGSEASGGMSVYSLAPTGAVYQSQLGYAANRGTAGLSDLDIVTVAGQTVLIPSGRYDDRLALHLIGNDGGFAGLSILGASPSLIGNLNESAALTVAGKTFLVSSQWGKAGFQTYQIRDDLSLEHKKTWGDTAVTHVGDISALATGQLAGRSYFFAASGVDAGVTCYWMGQWGNVKARGSAGPDEGLPISVASAIDTVMLDGKLFVILGSAGSGTLSVLRMNSWGGLFHEDTFLDSLNTRFAGVEAVETFTMGNRAFVLAGGSDDGVSLFELLPDGSLFHLDSIADLTTTSLQNVENIKATVIGGQVHIVVSGSDVGFTQFKLDLGTLANLKSGSDTADTLSGTNGNDLLYGKDGDDTIYGLGGHDRIIDGAGADTLYGGAGADVFIFVDDGRMDDIKDFDITQDRMDLSHFPMLYTFGQLNMAQKGFGVLITIGDDRIRVESHDGHQLLTSELTASHFIFDF